MIRNQSCWIVVLLSPSQNLTLHCLVSQIIKGSGANAPTRGVTALDHIVKLKEEAGGNKAIMNPCNTLQTKKTPLKGGFACYKVSRTTITKIRELVCLLETTPIL